MQQNNTNLENRNNRFSLGLKKFKEITRLVLVLDVIEAVTEYVLGMALGSAIGWLTGLCVGNTYVEHFEPAYYMDDLSELSRWSFMPYEFAKDGAIIGLVLGAIAIALINSKLLSRKVASLYEKEATEPKEIAQTLGRSERQIQKIIEKLVPERRVVCL